VADVVLLAFAETPAPAGGCGSCGLGDTGSGAAGGCAPSAAGPGCRAAVLACRDALASGGATVEIAEVGSDADIDERLRRLDGPARPDGLRWPAPSGPRLVVAAAADGQVRAVLRRLVRRYAPPPSRRPADLPARRTVPDLPPIGILPLDPAGTRDLAARLRLPREPAEVAKAVLHAPGHRLDLLRTDAGSVTAHGVVVGGAVPWSARIEVDDTVLVEPGEPVLACAIANADGYAAVSGLPLAAGADPTDGSVLVAVAVRRVNRSPLWGRRRVRIEVRRVRGRAVSVNPLAGVAYLDDGVAGVLGRRRSWWIEPGAWSVFRP
jgi:hypothetical protein